MGTLSAKSERVENWGITRKGSRNSGFTTLLWNIINPDLSDFLCNLKLLKILDEDDNIIFNSDKDDDDKMLDTIRTLLL